MVLRTRSRRAATSFLVRPLVSMVSWRWTVTVAGQSINTKGDRKSTRLNSSHTVISYAVFCLKTKDHASSPQTPNDLAGSTLRSNMADKSTPSLAIQKMQIVERPVVVDVLDLGVVEQPGVGGAVIVDPRDHFGRLLVNVLLFPVEHERHFEPLRRCFDFFVRLRVPPPVPLSPHMPSSV